MSVGADLDSQLISRSLEDPRVFEGIFERHFAAVSSFARRRLDRESADDVASEAFLIAFRRRDSFLCGSNSALPWLLGIAANLVRARYRADARQRDLWARAPREIFTDETVATIDRLDAAERSTALLQALNKLPSEQLETLLLAAWEGLNSTEIAVTLGVRPGTVRARLPRAREPLRRELGADNEVPIKRSATH